MKRSRGTFWTAALACALLGVSEGGSAQTKAPASTQPAGDKTWQMPRTAEGKPNFEGDWVNNTFTPLERPADLKDKPFMTPAEAVAYAERNIARQKSQPQDNIHYDDFIWMNEAKLRTMTERTSIIIDPPDGKLPPTNAEGQKRAQRRAAERKMQGAPSDRVQNRALSERCIIWGHEGPPMMPVGYNANIKIIQNAETIVIIQEMTHNTRVIPLVPKPMLSQAFRNWSGESRGWWEGDTLVVETSNYTDRTAFRGASQDMKVTERFTMPDAERLLYQFTVVDPATWDRPWTGEVSIMRTDGEIWEYACHEGNYGVRHILSAARVEEAASGKPAAPVASSPGEN